MNFLEKDLEEIIYESDLDKLKERGLPLKGICKRQLRIGNYGIADLVYFDIDRENKWLDINIVEIKKDNISLSAFMQLVRYKKGIQSYLNKRDTDFFIRFEYTLIGRDIDRSSDLVYLPDLVPSLGIYTFDYDFDGIKFQRHNNYVLTDEGFNVSKFMF